MLFNKNSFTEDGTTINYYGAKLITITRLSFLLLGVADSWNSRSDNYVTALNYPNSMIIRYLYPLLYLLLSLICYGERYGADKRACKMSTFIRPQHRQIILDSRALVDIPVNTIH
ncbi:hypothetical protein TNCV_4601461 [Trichonephila clavipes]|nr:hypothetical protein TNCV_4601461 [Trichonephila clavipes]